MARLVQSSRFVLQNALRQGLSFEGAISKRWCSSQHTLAVRKKIDDARGRAEMGGGKNRILSQHKKVVIFVFSLILS